MRESWSRGIVDRMRENGVIAGRGTAVRRSAHGTIVQARPAPVSRPSFSRLAFGSLAGGSSLVLFKGGLQFAVACVGGVIYVRRGYVIWSNLPMAAGVHTSDFAAQQVWSDGNYIYIDAGEAWEGLRFVFVEVKTGYSPEAWVRLSADDQIPVSDPAAELVRWPLASVAWTASGALSMVEPWHVGHINMTGIGGRP